MTDTILVAMVSMAFIVGGLLGYLFGYISTRRTQ